jgi:glycosyltransferase involved in cell wall biosynthesis
MKRIALIMHGGVGPPGSDRLVPAIMGLVERLSASFDVTVYTRFTPDGRERRYRCGQSTVTCVGTSHDLSGRNFVALAIAALLRDHRVSPFSLVHGFWGLPGGLAAVIAAKLAGVESVVSVLGGEAACLSEIEYGNMRRSLSRRPTLWALRQATHVTMLTHYQLHEFRRFGFARTEDLHIIPFGSDPSLFPFVERERTKPPFRLLHVGNLNRVKDQKSLLKAFRRVCRQSDSHLRIVGEGKEEGELKRFAQELGVTDRVTFAGFVRHEHLAEHYGWADLLVHTSLYEGQGVVFAEAAASGLPVCGTRVGLLADLGSPFSVTTRPGDDVSLADAILSLLGDEARRNVHRRTASAWAAEHTASWSAARIADVYRSILGQQVVREASAVVTPHAGAPARG